ncbi:MAG: hypothetical protein HY791_16170 [Deltaproteobacteria bacterium]|nr:hypothetical protein [Deltaproteobacteria bacterium]
MKAVVFLGPTISVDRARGQFADAEYWPPVGRGDVLRALEAGADRIGIVDGYFDRVPSVSHKEILFAIERGAIVFGSSSMGALRAAELWPFGMIGVGRIFELYRDGALEDDDEVAVIHGPAEAGYRAMSEAMVNIRDRLKTAGELNIVGTQMIEELLSFAKSLRYHERSLARVAHHASARLHAEEARQLQSFLSQPFESQKERDAVALLLRMASKGDSPNPNAVFVERSVFFERLRSQVVAERRSGSVTSTSMEPDAELLRLLAGEHAELLAARASDEEVSSQLAELCKQLELATVAELDAWLLSRSMTRESLLEMVREQLAVSKLKALYGPELDQRVRQRALLEEK